MARQAKLRKKNGYWFSEAGGIARYYGKVSEVPHGEAVKRFRAALADGGTDRKSSPVQATRPICPDQTEPSPDIEPISVNDLTVRFLAWLQANRSDRTHEERTRHLKRFRAAYGSLRATQVNGTHLESFRDVLTRRHDPLYVKKHEGSVRALFRWGVRHGLLPKGFQPFLAVETIRLETKPLLESELTTSEEVVSIFEHAGRSFGDMLRVYHATGARTGELTAARVGDYQPRTHQLVLGRHKRSRTMKGSCLFLLSGIA